MKSWINAIILFNEEGEKRTVELKQGLNIITGESKSGKSALLEIIDYCFASYYSTVPKGIITSFTSLYVIVLKINQSIIIIGRKSYNNGGRNKIFIKTEHQGFNFDKLSLDYFEEDFFISRQRAIVEIEKSLGMNLTNLTVDSAQTVKTGKPSVRNMMSYLLQHQNLIASKFALFYRFDDARKREQVINQFPIFSGWVDQEYYSVKYELDKLNKDLLKIKRDEIKYNEVINAKKDKLKEVFKHYYSLIGEEIDFEELSLEGLLELKDNLPKFTINSYVNENIKERYNSLNKMLEEKRRIKHKQELILSNLENSEEYGKTYLNNLEKLNSKTKVSTPTRNKYECPICGVEHNELNDKVIDLNHSFDWLQREVEAVNYRKNSFMDKIRSVKSEIELVNTDIKKLTEEIKEVERYHEGINEGKELQEQVLYAKAKIESETDIILNNSVYNFKDEILEKQNRIDELNEMLSNYNIEAFYSKASTEINENINRIIDGLDFEEEFKPVNMFFDLKDNFELYYFDRKNKRKIFLSEMGSGANWLACHIALFLSLQRYFCSMENSPIPKFLFFDQPSQVYFPDTSKGVNIEKIEQNADVIAVKKVYKAFLDEIKSIKNEHGFEPQIIVTDHVRSLDLESYDFSSYIRKSWFDEKLI